MQPHSPKTAAQNFPYLSDPSPSPTVIKTHILYPYLPSLHLPSLRERRYTYAY
jgi:hypothetical protein